jgi:hypothetical protein
MITPEMDYDKYNAAILKAGELTMTINRRKCEGWFQLNRATLAPLLTNCNQLLHAVKQSSHLPNPSNQPCRLISAISTATLPSLFHMQKLSGMHEYAPKSTT